MGRPTAIPPEAPRACALCPRLVAYREDNAAAEPTWFNGAAPSFGDPLAALLVVGLAPGRTGANRTGRPFTGDYAGDVLYPALHANGFARGQFDPAVYLASGDDGFRLTGAMVTNAVRCAPPQNKPTGEEIAQCRPFLLARITSLTRLKVILTLGRIAHDSTVRALGGKVKDLPFAHGAEGMLGSVRVLASYHTSRYNLNTRRLTEAMFNTVVARAAALAR